jgi:predicted transcriptional regulator
MRIHLSIIALDLAYPNSVGGVQAMALTLEDLLPTDQQLRTVQPHEPVDCAINIVYQHGYSQLPVTGANSEFQGQVITFESVLRAIQCFRTEAGALLVRDAAQRVRSYAADADLLATLDDIHRDNFALIVDESRLIGIVTTADMAVFFREYAQDLMLIEGIESRVKDAIRALYAGDDDGLDSAIVRCFDGKLAQSAGEREVASASAVAKQRRNPHDWATCAVVVYLSRQQGVRAQLGSTIAHQSCVALEGCPKIEGRSGRGAAATGLW